MPIWRFKSSSTMLIELMNTRAYRAACDYLTDVLARVRLQNEYVGINDNHTRPYVILGLKGPSIFSTHKQDFTSSGRFYLEPPGDASFSATSTCPQIGSQNEFFNRCA